MLVWEVACDARVSWPWGEKNWFLIQAYLISLASRQAHYSSDEDTVTHLPCLVHKEDIRTQHKQV